MFTPDSLQIVIFLSDIHMSDATQHDLIKDIAESSDEFFILKTKLPVPQEAPKEIPRLIFANESSSSSLQVSLGQLNFEFKIEQHEELSYYVSIVNKVTNLLAQKHNLLTDRMGIVINYSLKGVDDAISYASKFIIFEDVVSDSRELQVHALKNTVVNGIPSNAWLRLLAGKQDSKDIVKLIVDINVIKDHSTFNHEKIKSYGNEAVIEAKKLTKLFS